MRTLGTPPRRLQDDHDHHRTFLRRIERYVSVDHDERHYPFDDTNEHGEDHTDDGYHHNHQRHQDHDHDQQLARVLHARRAGPHDPAVGFG